MRNTFTKPADFWQQRDFGNKISATFEFMGAHWRPLGKVLLYLVVPLALLQSILTLALQTQLISTVHRTLYNSEAGSSLFSRQIAFYSESFQSPLYLLNNALSVAFHAMLILSVYGYLYHCVYPTETGGPITVAEVWGLAKRRFLGTFFSLYGISIIVVLGFFVLFIPGVYLSVVLSLFFVVSVLEHKGFGTTINRCVSLASGKWWSTFGLLAIMGLIIWLMFASVGAAVVLFGGLRSMLLSSGTGASPFLLAIGALTGLITLLVYPPILLAIAFQYFNLVERKEGHGLRLLVDALGQPQATPAAHSSHYRPDDEGEY